MIEFTPKEKYFSRNHAIIKIKNIFGLLLICLGNIIYGDNNFLSYWEISDALVREITNSETNFYCRNFCIGYFIYCLWLYGTIININGSTTRTGNLKSGVRQSNQSTWSRSR